MALATIVCVILYVEDSKSSPEVCLALSTVHERKLYVESSEAINIVATTAAETPATKLPQAASSSLAATTQLPQAATSPVSAWVAAGSVFPPPH